MRKRPARWRELVRTAPWLMAVVISGCSLFAGGEKAEEPKHPGLDLGPTGKTQMQAGNGQTCGIRASGSLFCWGRNADQAPKGLYRKVATGSEHACAIRAEEPRKGEVDCWGLNDAEQAEPRKGVFIELAAGAVHT